MKGKPAEVQACAVRYRVEELGVGGIPRLDSYQGLHSRKDLI